MKLSIKAQDHLRHLHHQKQPPPPQLSNENSPPPLLFRAKIPISIFNLPFISGFSTTTQHPSELSLSLSTNFPSGPSLKLSYSTTATAAAPASASPPPLTLTLKSGIGPFGSPKDSPLVISANFSYNPNYSNSNPTFSLLFKPQLGSFCLKKSTFSNPLGSSSGGNINGDSANSFGFVPLERPLGLKDFSLGNDRKDSIFKGFSVLARTEMPVANRVLMNFRWGVNFPEDFCKQIPYLTVNKFEIEKVNEVKEVKEAKEKKAEGSAGDSELLKGMCLWMKRELEMLQKEKIEMKHKLDEMKLGGFKRNGNTGVNEFNGKKRIPAVEDSSGFEEWRSKKNAAGEESSKKENKINGNKVSDVESELQRAIKAAAASSS